MNIDLDDPKLTAFALGDLSGAEHEQMAEAIAASPEAQTRVEEIQAFAQLVRGEFRLDLKRAAEKRLSILSLLEQGNFWSDWRWVSLAAAAMLAIAAVIAAIALAPSRTPGFLVGEKRKAAEDRVVRMEVDATSNAAPLPPTVASNFDAPPPEQRAGENTFATASSNAVSTFPVNVGTASYAKVRRSISSGSRPPKDAVRIEEMVNYFGYDYPQPEGDGPFSINVDAATCPWQPANQLVRIGLKGREIANENRGASNLVFLLDVSGSMRSADRLPLVRSAMRSLVDRLTENDRIAIVVYAGASGVALPSTSGHRKEEIVRAIERLEADALPGNTEGIELAYRIAADNFIIGGINRVIIATDGELNVGVANQRELVQIAKKRAKSGVSLTLLGLGDDTLRHAAMQKIAEKITGDYAHLDTVDTARRALVEQINGTLVTIASDVEVQVVFNPVRVASYRLIGYDGRPLRHEQSSGERIGTGEIAAGHTVTALYEIVPASAQNDAPASGELVTVKLHHKQPESGIPLVTEHSVDANVADWQQAPADFRFAAAVAQFGMMLRDSPHRGTAKLATVLEWAEGAKGRDEFGYRAGFVDLLRQAQALAL